MTKENVKTETVETSFEGMIAHDVKVQRQPRTLMIPNPKTFYFEPQTAKRKEDSGNNHDQISTGVHQVDPNRLVSRNPIMPSLALLKDTGNPFPKDHHHESVVTSKAWEPYVKFAHVAWQVLNRQKEPVRAKDILEDVVKRSKVGAKPDGTIPSKTKNCLKDVLRDLRLYGLVASDKPTANFNSTYWGVVDNPDQIEMAG